MRYFLAIFAFAIVAMVSILGFRGEKSSNAPLFIFPDMAWQPKYFPQGENQFFADKRDDRPVVQGTVQRGYGWAMKEVFSTDFSYAPAQNPPLYSGHNPDGSFYTSFPVKVDKAFIELGHQKFDINCAVCHGITGDGNGITKAAYGMTIVRNLTDSYTSVQPTGQIFTTITYGRGKMGSYGERLSPSERWAVVAYVRSLQLAGNYSANDLPTAERAKLGL